MRSEEIVEALATLDAQFPTDAWTVGDLHVLPLVRYEVATANYDLHLRATSQTPGQGGRRVTARMRDAAVRALPRKQHATLPTGPVDALLYSDGVSLVQLAGRYYDRFCDPIAELLAERGATSVVVTPDGIDETAPRHLPPVFIQPELERARFLGAAGGRLRPPRARMEGYEEAMRLLRAQYPSIHVPSIDRLGRNVAYIEAFARVYTRLLRRLRPRAVYITCYYGAERFAMVVAARRLGIHTVDVQHGYSGPLHWAYGGWGERWPANGFELLPEYFWCWSEDERATIAAWAERSRGAHRALVGGNVFADAWRRGHTDVVTSYDERVLALLQRHPDRRSVLYAANGLESDEELIALAKAIQQTEGEFFWYVRLHPCRLGDQARVERILRTGGAGNVDIDNASSLPLYALLRHLSLHATQSSTTIIEATDFGVPSVLVGTLEASSFEAYLSSGWALATTTTTELPDALRAQDRAREALASRSERSATAPGLEALLTLATTRRFDMTTASSQEDDRKRSSRAGTGAREALARDGYVVVPGVMDGPTVAGLRRSLVDIFDRPSTFDGDLNKHSHYNRAYFDAFNRYASLRWIPFHPPIVSTLRELLGDDFVYIPEVAIHDSGYGGWHKDTTAQEVAGLRFQWQPDFRVVQIAMYLQDNDPFYAGGLDVIPGSHRKRDRIVKPGANAVTKLASRALYRLKTWDDNRRGKSLPVKAGDLIVFDYRLDHRATQPVGRPIPAHLRKLAIFMVASANNRHAQSYLDFIKTRADYKYLPGYRYTPELAAEAAKAKVRMLEPFPSS